MSYRFGLSPSDVVQDARGNVLNTTLTLYVLEADADARTNALTSVPVSSGNWTYTHATYKSLWARTATSDKFPVVSVDAQIASLGTAVTVTDNGDGGFTIGTSKLGGWQWAKDTFVQIANAVALAVTTPVKPSAAGSAGTALTAARGDHSHPSEMNLGAPLFGSGAVMFGSQVAFHTPIGGTNGIPTVTNLKGPMTPLPIYRRQTIKELNIKIGTAGDASATSAFSIYATTGTGVLTGNPVYTSSFIATTGTGIKTWSSLNITLEPGMYWLVLNSKGFTSTRPLPFVADRNPVWPLWMPVIAGGASGSDAVSGMTVATVDETTGAFPSPILTTNIQYGNNNPTAWWYAYQADAA